MWQMRRWKRALRRIIVSLTILGLIMVWQKTGDTIRQFLGAVATVVDPVAAPVADWLDRTVGGAAAPGEEGHVPAVREDAVETHTRAEGSAAMEEAPARRRGWTTCPFEPSGGSGGATRTHRRAVAEAGALSGPAYVLDGDTLEVGGVRVRMRGIDAPEGAQSCRAAGRSWPCGHEATRALKRRIGSKRVECKGRDRDTYGRVLAPCSAAGQDLGAWMVAQGWAFSDRFSRAYAAEESAARRARRGVWRGEVVPPWEWRKGKRLAGASRCDIKGNISRSGKRIYHVPGGSYYTRTRIDTSRGERWFCSEQAARAAGWRRSKR